MRSIPILAIASTLCISSAAFAAAPSTSPRTGGASGTNGAQSGTMAQSPNSATTTSPTTSSTTTTQRGPSSTGQPSQDCAAPGNTTPGNSASAPGSAFNPDGTAGTKYAGQQPQNSGNTASVSQYDVGCAKNQSHR